MSKPYSRMLLLGLSNSGKTSILKYFQGFRNLSSFSEIKPTIHIDFIKYQAIDQEYIVWEFGGQKEYINEYLKNFYSYLVNTKKILFVIDIQDKKKYAPSLDFLQKIVNLLINNDSKIEVSVYLHKLDPDLNQTHPEITKQKIDNLIREIIKIFPRDYKYNISKTSIYMKFKEHKVKS